MPLSLKENHFSYKDNANITLFPALQYGRIAEPGNETYMNHIDSISSSLRRRFNTPDALVVVSYYPSRGETYTTGKTGVASYTKNIVKHMKRPVIVLSDIETKPEWYTEGHVLVVRCFHPHRATMWVDILMTLRAFPAVKTILMQFDFAMYGSPLVSSLGMATLGLLHTQGYHTAITLHHVVDDIMKLKGHVGLSDSTKDRLIGSIYNTLFHSFYRILAAVTSQIIVLEESLKYKLEQIAPWVSATAIPHGVDTSLRAMDKMRARKKLGLKPNEHVILFFGYVNWFKGADIFAKTFSRVGSMLGKPVRAIIAGGESPTLQQRPYYQKFFRMVRRETQSSSTVSLTGYVPQSDIAAYFSAADLVVFPYRHYMTASGVLSLAFSYRKPFIISKPLAEMFESDDFTRYLTQTGLTIRDITCDLSPQSIVELSRDVLANGRKKKLADLAVSMREIRAYPRIAKLYETHLFSPALSMTQQPAIRYTYVRRNS